jgi:hypothetical protein
MIKHIKKIPPFNLIKEHFSLFLTVIQLSIIIFVFIPPINAQPIKKSLSKSQLNSNQLIKNIQAADLNNYIWLIDSANSWEDLQSFLPTAKLSGITILVSLLPPSKTPPIVPSGDYSEPYRLDFVTWAQAIAKLSLKYSNLKEYTIEDMQQNLDMGFFTQSYTDSVRSTGLSINPKLQFITSDANSIYSSSTLFPKIYTSATSWMKPAGTKSILTFAGVYNDSSHVSTNAEAISVGLKWCSQNNYATYFPAGKYLINSTNSKGTFRLYPNNIIICDSGKTIFYTSTVTSGQVTGMFCDDADWAAVDSTQRNLYIDGITIIGAYPFNGSNGVGAGNSFSVGIYAWAGSPKITLDNILVRRCNFSKIQIEACRIIGARVAWVENNYTYNTMFTGFTLENDTSIVIHNRTSNTYSGIESYGSSKYWGATGGKPFLYLDNNNINVGANYGISAGGGGAVTVSNNTISGQPVLDQSSGAGIQIVTLQRGSDAPEVTNTYSITGNTIIYFYNGIKVNIYNILDTVRSLIITGNTLDRSIFAGIALEDTSVNKYMDSTRIIGNTFKDWDYLNYGGDAAIYLNHYQNTYMSGNIFIKSTAGWKSPLTLSNTNMIDFVNNDCTNISTVKAIWTDNLTYDYYVWGNTGLPTNAIYNYDKASYENQLSGPP